MTITYKILGQVSPGSAINTALYTVPGSTSTVISSIIACNRAPSGGTFRIAVGTSASEVNNSEYIAYNTSLADNDTVILTSGITIGTGKVISVYSAGSSISFSVFGAEIT